MAMPSPRRLAPFSISRRLISPFTKRVVRSRPFSNMGLSSPSVLLGLLGLTGLVPALIRSTMALAVSSSVIRPLISRLSSTAMIACGLSEPPAIAMTGFPLMSSSLIATARSLSSAATTRPSLSTKRPSTSPTAPACFTSRSSFSVVVRVEHMRVHADLADADDVELGPLGQREHVLEALLAEQDLLILDRIGEERRRHEVAFGRGHFRQAVDHVERVGGAMARQRAQRQTNLHPAAGRAADISSSSRVRPWPTRRSPWLRRAPARRAGNARRPRPGCASGSKPAIDGGGETEQKSSSMGGRSWSRATHSGAPAFDEDPNQAGLAIRN